MKHVTLTFLTVLISFVFLEIALSFLSLMSPRIDRLLAPPSAGKSISRTVSDERLGHRPNPAFPEHDSNGFRNPKILSKAEVVALGDSQTYGTGVESKQAWPRQLESMIQQRVYSMAFGGYGPVESLILLDEAIALEPKIIIEAFYSGNDLFDTFDIVYNSGQHVSLKSTDLQLLEGVRKAEETKPIVKSARQIFGGRKLSTNRTKSFLRAFISQRSKIYGLIRRTRHEVKLILIAFQDPWERARTIANPAYTQAFNNGQFRTIFTSEYRFLALNLEDPRITEGHRIALRAIQKMNDRASDKKIRFIVVLIPTKELVFQKLVENPSLVYRNLTDNEVVTWKISKDFFEHNGIEYLDALPALQEQLSLGIQPYHASIDGHPNEHGHKAIANLITSYLNESH